MPHPTEPSHFPHLQLRPIARDEFRNSLRKKILTIEHSTENFLVPEKKNWFTFSLRPFALALILLLVFALSLITSKPVWSKMREKIRRFFIVTTTENTVATSTEFWSNLSQNELIPNFPYTASTLNSLTPQEQNQQPPIPPGFATITEYLIAIYQLNHFSSISEILESTPAKVIREEPYLETGKLYILEFPGNYIIAYTELNVPISDTTSTLIRSFR